MTSADLIWTIPPIQDAIAGRLWKADLRHCILVSHAFHQCFIPFLWHDINLRSVVHWSRFIKSPAQPNHRHFVRKLVLDANRWELLKDDHATLNVAFPNVTTLFWMSGFPLAAELVGGVQVFLVGSHHSLQSLYLQRQMISPEVLQPFQQMMADVRSLQEISLQVEGAISVRDQIAVLQSCTRLRKLKFEARSGASENELPDFITVDFEETNIEDLEFLVRGPGADDLLFRFLRSCPRLKRLRASSSFKGPGVTHELGTVVKTTCTRLEGLILDNQRIKHTVLASLFEHCPGLKQLDWFTPKDKPLLVLKPILAHHRKTLERIGFHHRRPVLISHLFLLAHCCKGLKELNAIIDCSKASSDVTKKLELWSKKPWACHGLVSLHLGFAYQEPIGPVMEDRELDFIFEQLKFLPCLSKLTLTAPFGDKSIVGAFLRTLENIGEMNSLREFWFPDYESALLEQEDTTWVGELWPRLWFLNGRAGVWGSIERDQAIGIIRASRDTIHAEIRAMNDALDREEQVAAVIQEAEDE